MKVGIDELWVNAFIEAVGLEGMGMYFVISAPLNDSNSHKLISEYISTYVESPQHIIPFSYDAANQLLHAIENVAVQEKDGTLHTGRKALRDSLYAISGFDDVMGRLICDELGDCGV